MTCGIMMKETIKVLDREKEIDELKNMHSKEELAEIILELQDAYDNLNENLGESQKHTKSKEPVKDKDFGMRVFKKLKILNKELKKK